MIQGAQSKSTINAFSRTVDEFTIADQSPSNLLILISRLLPTRQFLPGDLRTESRLHKRQEEIATKIHWRRLEHKVTMLRCEVKSVGEYIRVVSVLLDVGM